jgi:hypothetical protein
MLTRLVVFVTDDELCALQAMSEADIRRIREQLRFLLREEARRRGLLEPQSHGLPTACLPGRQEVGL